MKRGKNNKAVLINRIIKVMEAYADRRQPDNPIGIFWRNKAEKFKSLKPSKLKKAYLQAFINAIVVRLPGENVYHMEETNESKSN
nr:MAG TPA: hypothetical protein [Caudoviricetes sp.]